jgi:hypothetical protein
MNVEQMALVQGWGRTKGALRHWQRDPTILAPWALGSTLVAIGLLCATWVVAMNSTPDPFGITWPGVTQRATFGDYEYVLFRNGLVLTLHALACVAGFIAGSSLPQIAPGKKGLWRTVHEKAGPAAIAFVVGATTFSLATQAYVLGGEASSLSHALHLSPALLLLALTPHAIPELFALFLPLAAWTMASRRGRWDELLAATFVTVAIAVPILLFAGAVETYVTPHLIRALAY